MDYPWAVVGAKVVCVEDTAGIFDVPGKKYFRDPTKFPVKGKTYTIKSIQNHIFDNTQINFLLEEIPKRNEGDTGFNIKRFKPLEFKKLPDVLTSILINPKKKIERDMFDKKRVDA